MLNGETSECCILGAGPAGLAIGYELIKNGITDIVIVDRNSIVGGLSRTEIFDGNRFDVGPHRFFTKNAEVNQIWHDVLGDDFISVERLTRIYYNQKYFNYPIKAFDAVSKLGLLESIKVIVSYLASIGISGAKSENFEEWMIEIFGRKLYEIFFKTYTEKLWGIPCTEISAEWAAQRIKGLDIIQVIKSALMGNTNHPKSLVEEFDYPRLGAGQMYEAIADIITAKGGTIHLNTDVVSVQAEDNTIKSITVRGEDGANYQIQAGQFFSSIPLTHFITKLHPAEDEKILKASESLYFRDHITVNVLVDGENHFPDQWIYIHSPEVQMARLANYNNFSKDMVRQKGKSALSIEYFLFQHEPLWQKTDEELKTLAIDELELISLVKRDQIAGGWVVRETESYPTYYIGFKEPYQVLIERFNDFGNLYPIGRGGMYKYNNQDHSFYSGLLAAKNYLKSSGSPFNLWNINIDAEYHERGIRS